MVKYMKKNHDITEPSQSEHILVRKVRPVRARRVVWVDNFSSMF